MPQLFAAANPWLRALTRSCTSGKSRATISALLSREALSTTIVSTRTDVALSWSDIRHACRRPLVFQLTITTDTSVRGSSGPTQAALRSCAGAPALPCEVRDGPVAASRITRTLLRVHGNVSTFMLFHCMILAGGPERDCRAA